MTNVLTIPLFIVTGKIFISGYDELIPLLSLQENTCAFVHHKDGIRKERQAWGRGKKNLFVKEISL